MNSFEKKTDTLAPKAIYVRRILFASCLSFMFLLFSLGIGMIGYHYYAGLSWIDSLLNASMILTGMGPVDRLETDTSKLFASFYSIYSGVAFLSAIGLFVAPIVHRFLHRFHIDDEDEK